MKGLEPNPGGDFLRPRSIRTIVANHRRKGSEIAAWCRMNAFAGHFPHSENQEVGQIQVAPHSPDQRS
jgi:hypothetical protein